MKKIICLLLLFLQGCAATGPIFRPAEKVDPSHAVLYIYRAKTFAVAARAAYFYIDDINVFDLNVEGYSWVALPAGRYKLKQKWAPDMLAKPIELDVEVKAGETRYMSFETGTCKAGYKEICIEWILQDKPASIGRSEIADKRFQDNFGFPRLMKQLAALPAGAKGVNGASAASGKTTLDDLKGLLPAK